MLVENRTSEETWSAQKHRVSMSWQLGWNLDQPNKFWDSLAGEANRNQPLFGAFAMHVLNVKELQSVVGEVINFQMPTCHSPTLLTFWKYMRGLKQPTSWVHCLHAFTIDQCQWNIPGHVFLFRFWKPCRECDL